MSPQGFRSDRVKLGLAIFWFVFTFSMVVWWWMFALGQLDTIAANLPPGKFDSVRRMLLWEGFILLVFILVGGVALLILTKRERMRNFRLRLFFSNFSHDMKTSLNRLRLRAEVLSDMGANPKLQKLMDEVNRLDLQLENSLWVSKGEEQKLLQQEISLHQLISKLRPEWPDIEIHLRENATIIGDSQALQSVFRNLLQNATLHGSATRVEIQVEQIRDNRIRVIFQDNGSGFAGDLHFLGNGILPQPERYGNGIGLYLVKSLLERMQCQIDFPKSDSGFQVRIEAPGHLGGRS